MKNINEKYQNIFVTNNDILFEFCINEFQSKRSVFKKKKSS